MPPDHPITISVLGPPDIRLAGERIPLSVWTTTTAQHVVLYLVECPDGVRPDELMAAFWPSSSGERARSALTTTIHRARRAIGCNVVRWVEGCYRVDLPPGSEYDLARFRALLATTTCQTGEEKARTLEAALALVRGDYLAGLLFEWVIDRRWTIERDITDAMLALAGIYADRQLWQRAIRWYHAVLRRDELIEDAHRGLMRCYTGQGNRARAVRHFRQLERLLKLELGVEPDPCTVALYQVIRTRE